MFQQIDWFLLSHFEKRVCHPLQRLTGKTNFYYAGLCSFLITLTLFGAYFNILPKELTGKNNLIYDPHAPTWFWTSVFLFTTYSLLFWKMHEAWVYTQLNNGTANIIKALHTGRLARILYVMVLPFVLLLPVPEIQIYDKAFFVFLFFFLFFVSCDPLPPCKGKVKEWLKSFGKKPTLAAIKTGE